MAAALARKAVDYLRSKDFRDYLMRWGSGKEGGLATHSQRSCAASAAGLCGLGRKGAVSEESDLSDVTAAAAVLEALGSKTLRGAEGRELGSALASNSNSSFS